MKLVWVWCVLLLVGCLKLSKPMETGTYQCVNELEGQTVEFVIAPNSEVKIYIETGESFVDGRYFDPNWVCKLKTSDGGVVKKVLICNSAVCYVG